MEENKSVMTVKGWLGTLLLLCIPVVNIVLLFVWGFGSGNENRRNYAKASLIMIGIALILYIILFALFMVALAS